MRSTRYPSQLSGGMQQRLAIAQALIMEPKVLLLDEPFGALDPATRKSMHRLILDLWARNRMTVVMVTHDIEEAFTLGTRILMVDKLRRDPHAPAAYGSGIVEDIRLDPAKKPPIREEAQGRVHAEPSSRAIARTLRRPPSRAPMRRRRRRRSWPADTVRAGGEPEDGGPPRCGTGAARRGSRSARPR